MLVVPISMILMIFSSSISHGSDLENDYDAHYCKETGDLEYPRQCLEVWQRQHNFLCQLPLSEKEKTCSLLNRNLMTLNQYFENTEKEMGICTIQGEHIRIYNTSTHICCSNGKVRKKRYTDNVCCNGTIFDANGFVCCNDTLYTVAQLPRGVVHQSGKICCTSNCNVIDNTRYNHFYDNSKQKDKGIQFREKYDNTSFEDSSMSKDVVILVSIVLGLVIVCTLVLVVAKFFNRTRSLFTRFRSKSQECSAELYDSPGSSENGHNTSYRPNNEINRYLTVNSRSHQRILISSQGDVSSNIKNSQQQCEMSVANDKSNISLKTDSAVQTCLIKTPNVFDSMGNCMSSVHVFDENHRHLHLKNSEVSFLISQEDIHDGPVDCYASTFRNISDIHKKLKLAKSGDVIVSPAVEFLFPNRTKLARFAIVEMPFVGDEEHIRVWRVESDLGKPNQAQRHMIPAMSEVDMEDTNLDVYYEITKEKKVRIYARRFSWFVCTCGKDHQNFGIVSTLYWSLGRIGNANIASVTLYLIPNNMYFKDYLEIVDKTERKRTEGEQKRLLLPECVRSDDGQFILKMCLQHENWKHRLDPEEGTELFPREQCVEVRRVLSCYEEKDSGLPFCVEWQLENYEQNYPIGFEGIFKVKYRHYRTNVETNTVLTINEELISPRVAYEGRAEEKKDELPVTVEAAHPSEYICSPESI